MKLYTIDEAAVALNVSPDFVLQEISAGALEMRPDGGIDAAVLEPYAERMRARQARALQDMADEAPRLGLEY